MTNIKQLQLVTGQMVIGKVTEETDMSVVLEHPLGIRVVQTPSGQLGLEFVPFDIANPEGKTKFYRSAIVSEPLNIPEVMTTSYLERTSSIQIISALDQMEGFRK